MTSGSSYMELEETQYHQYQKLLLKTKGGKLQRDFIEALQDSEEFLSLLDDSVETKDGEELPTFDGPLTESSFKEPTADQELRMHELWRNTPPSAACRVSFWASVSIEHLRANKIAEPTWLAANGGITETGEERIDRALSLHGEEGDKAVDDCVRTVFRRMSGLPTARGNRSVFVNPSFGRGWWRERIVARVSERGAGVEERPSLLEVVRRNQQYWENLVTMIVSRGSVLGSTDVQDAVINSLAMHLRVHLNTPLRNAATLNATMRRLSNIAAYREIGVMEFGEIGQIVDDLLVRVSETQG